MKTIKELIKYLCFLGIVAFAMWFGYEASEIAHKYPEPFKLPSLVDIQREIGVEPDGIYGAKTKAAWEIAYANQEAAKFMTPSGGPKEN